MPITDVLQMMGRAGRPQYDNMGIALIMVDILYGKTRRLFSQFINFYF